MAQRAGAGGLYLLGGDVASGIVLIVGAGVCNAGAEQLSVDQRAELVGLVVVSGGLVLAGAASRTGKLSPALRGLDIIGRVVGVVVLADRGGTFAEGDSGEGGGVSGRSQARPQSGGFLE